MKITHIIRNFEIGGLETVVLRLARIQVSKGMKVRIVCIEKEIGPTLIHEDCGLEIVKIDKRNNLVGMCKVFFELLHNRPDIINTHNFLANVYGGYVGVLLRIPVCLTLHSGAKQNSYEYERKSTFIPRRYICVSDDIKNNLLACSAGQIHADQIEVILNGIDPSELSKESSSNIREELNIYKDDLLIGTVGRLHPVKNQILLIDAIARLKHEIANIKLLVVGDGPLRGELESRTKELNIEDLVTFVGSRSDVPVLLKGMDIFVLPSLYEGSPISLIEALGMRLPVVASSVGAIPNIIQNGSNGFLVKPDDIDNLVSVIQELAKNQQIRKRVGDNGYRSIVENFSMEKMQHNYNEAYRKAIVRR